MKLVSLFFQSGLNQDKILIYATIGHQQGGIQGLIHRFMNQ